MSTNETAVVLADSGGVVRAWNEAATALFGWSADDVVGRRLDVIVPEPFRDAHWAGFDAVMAGGPPRIEGMAAHLPVQCADGEVRAFPGRLAVVRDAHGAAVGAVGTYLPRRGDEEPFTPVGGVWPRVRRVVTDLGVPDPAADAAFWTGLFAMDTPMDLGWVVNHRTPQGHQVQLMSRDASAPEDPAVSVEVTGVAMLDQVHAEAVAAGYEIVHPLTDEPWGVRRFFVRTPQGVVVNVLAHP